MAPIPDLSSALVLRSRNKHQWSGSRRTLRCMFHQSAHLSEDTFENSLQGHRICPDIRGIAQCSVLSLVQNIVSCEQSGGLEHAKLIHGDAFDESEGTTSKVAVSDQGKDSVAGGASVGKTDSTQ